MQLDAQRAVVKGADADGGEVLCLAGGEILRAAHDEIVERIRRAEGRREDALRAEGEVRRRHRVAVGPTGVRAQVKGVGQAVGGNIPALGDARDRVQVLRVVAGEALVERHQDLVMRIGLHHRRVEVLRLGADVLVQHLGAVAELDRGLVPAAADG